VATVTLSSGAATYNTAALSAGSTSIGANYSGDSNFFSSSASSLSQTVNAAVNWVVSAAPVSGPDPEQGTTVTFGPVSFSPLSGGLMLAVAHRRQPAQLLRLRLRLRQRLRLSTACR